MELTVGMFGSEFGRRVDTPFELHAGQMRMNNKMTHNSGWYNIQGEKLGWGDLSVGDFNRIRQNLEPKQAFIILPEHASFWQHVEQFGPIGSMCKVSGTERAPGREFVRENMNYLITNGGIYCIRSDYDTSTISGVDILGLPRHDANRMLDILEKL